MTEDPDLKILMHMIDHLQVTVSEITLAGLKDNLPLQRTIGNLTAAMVTMTARVASGLDAPRFEQFVEDMKGSFPKVLIETRKEFEHIKGKLNL